MWSKKTYVRWSFALFKKTTGFKTLFSFVNWNGNWLLDKPLCLSISSFLLLVFSNYWKSELHNSCLLANSQSCFGRAGSSNCWLASFSVKIRFLYLFLHLFLKSTVGQRKECSTNMTTNEEPYCIRASPSRSLCSRLKDKSHGWWK